MSIEIKQINKAFGRTPVLNDISLDIPSGEMVALLGPSGSGKTTLLIRLIERLSAQLPIIVIEGDQQTDADAQRIRATGVPAIQINTGKGCHLDAHMIGHALEELPSPRGGALFIENVGNLVCPTSWDLGESLRVALLSVTEGEDKPLKYPGLFNTSDVAMITKIDLADVCEFNRSKAIESIESVRPGMRIFETSVKSGLGMNEWIEFLQHVRTQRINKTQLQTM